MNYQANVVLVNSKYASNIGASARAIANMGGSQLILIDPKTQIDLKARQAAAGAQQQLEDLKIYKNWQHFLKHESNGVIIALSKRRGQNRPSAPLRHQIQNISGSVKNNTPMSIYFVFGPEDNGLSASDITHCHQVAHLPEYGDFCSYNLSQAVLLSLFITNEVLIPQPTQNISVSEDLIFPDESLTNWLAALGYDLSSPKVNIFKTLKAMIQRSVPTQKELSNLENALQQSIRKLNN